MRIREWFQANQQDERERYYYARAGALAWSAMSAAGLIAALVYMLNDRQDEAMVLTIIVILGLVVWASLILRYKVTR